MRVNRKIILDASLSSVNATAAYTDGSGSSLMQHYIRLEASDTMGAYFRRCSHDNGRTWSDASCIFTPFKTEKGTVRRGENTLFYDKEKSALVHVYNLHIYPDDIFSGGMYRYTRIFFEISFDGGKNFSAPEQLIQEGYDELNWADGICWGKNQSMISFSAMIRQGDVLILPAQRMPLDGDFSKPYRMPLEAGCFIGRWKGNTIIWNCSNWVKINEKLSARGIFEPAITELKDKSLIMICRASNGGTLDIPSYKWRCSSRDGGFNWSSPEPLKYSDGTDAFSPSSGSRLIRNSSNYKLYWIGNLTGGNPDGNRPRYPLVISEFDEDRKTLIKESIEIIDSKNEKDSPLVQLSNFKVYEDRETYEFVLNMARLQERAESVSENISGNAVYEYRMKI